MKIVFMGTGSFASASLQKLLEVYPKSIVAVYTKPRGRGGRGRNKDIANPVREIAQNAQIPIYDPMVSLSDASVIKTLRTLSPDVIIVASYGKILPQSVLDIPQYGCVNVHASLLPRWRGASPIHHALLAGDTTTGITIMRIDAGLDTGPIIAQTSFAISPTIRLPGLYDRLAQLGAKLLVETLPKYIAQDIVARPQPQDSITVCRTLTRSDGMIDWTQSARAIFNQFRALTPWPGVFTIWQKSPDVSVRIKIIDMAIRDEQLSATPGTIFQTEQKELAIATSSGIVIPRTLQREGKQAISAQDFLNGNPDIIGAHLQKL